MAHSLQTGFEVDGLPPSTKGLEIGSADFHAESMNFYANRAKEIGEPAAQMEYFDSFMNVTGLAKTERGQQFLKDTRTELGAAEVAMNGSLKGGNIIDDGQGQHSVNLAELPQAAQRAQNQGVGSTV